MTVEDELHHIEAGFWTKGEDYYRAHVDENCLISFTDMAGAQSRELIAASAKTPRDWKGLHVERKGCVQPSEDIALINYMAAATHPDGRPYRALVSSGYVRRGKDWKMVFHGQTPLANK